MAITCNIVIFSYTETVHS